MIPEEVVVELERKMAFAAERIMFTDAEFTQIDVGRLGAFNYAADLIRLHLCKKGNKK